VLGSHGGTVECKESAAFEDSIHDGVGEILIVEDAAPGGERFIGGEDHRALFSMSIVDDVEEHVRGVGPVGEITDLVDDEDTGMHIAGQGLGKSSAPECGREFVDEFGGRHKPRIETVLNRPIGDGDGQMCFPPARFAAQDQAAALDHKLRREH
jgi:hypothetical protein